MEISYNLSILFLLFLRFGVFWFSGVLEWKKPNQAKLIYFPFLRNNRKMKTQSFLLLHFKNLSSVEPGLPHSFPFSSQPTALSHLQYERTSGHKVFSHLASRKKKDNLALAASCSMKCLFNYGDSTLVAFPL